MSKEVLFAITGSFLACKDAEVDIGASAAKVIQLDDESIIFYWISTYNDNEDVDLQDVYETVEARNLDWKYIILGSTLNDVEEATSGDSILEEVFYIKREIGINEDI